MKRFHLRRELLLVVAAACVVLALFLALAAADVRRWHNTVPADDVRFRVGSGSAKLWSRRRSRRSAPGNAC